MLNQNRIKVLIADDNKDFWRLLDEALKGLVERDHPHTSRKYRNNDPVTVVNY